MSIVATVISRDGNHIVERHTDHLGGEYTQTWFAPAGWTLEQIEAKAEEHAAQIEVSLAEGEEAQMVP